MKLEIEYNIGDVVYGIAWDGKGAYGTISDIMIQSDGVIQVFLKGSGKACRLENIGNTETEVFERYCKSRYVELTDEIIELMQLAKEHNIELGGE